MKIDAAFYDDDIAFEHVLTLFRNGQLQGVEVTLCQQENRLRYHLRGDIDESVVLEQALRATPIIKIRGRPGRIPPFPPPPRAMLGPDEPL
jgi:hypothetical protein